MRSLHAILLAALTIVVIAVSVILTASHFGMRNWPTPPMPDTATRLITPTEGAAKVRQRMSDGRDPVEVQVAADAGADVRRDERTARPGTSRRAESGRRSPTRRSTRTGRRSRTSRGDNAGPGSSGGTGTGAATPAQPAAPESTPDTPAAPAAPVTEAGSGDQSQARPDQTPPATSTPAPPLVPLVPVAPVAPQLPPTSGHDDTPQDPSSDGPGHGHRPHRSGTCSTRCSKP
jgi:hypothetical protein